jgi:predicted DCC family thiol-disulfide oxidoreductase YuxK
VANGDHADARLKTEAERSRGKNIPDGIVLMDGMCVLCSRSFHFVAARDPAARFRFAALQGAYGRWMAGLLGIDPDDPESFAVVVDGAALTKSDGVIAILRALPGWSWCGALRWMPRPIRDWVYDRVARNRYRIFGRYDVCALPNPALARHMAPALPPTDP